MSIWRRVGADAGGVGASGRGCAWHPFALSPSRRVLLFAGALSSILRRLAGRGVGSSRPAGRTHQPPRKPLPVVDESHREWCAVLVAGVARVIPQFLHWSMMLVYVVWWEFCGLSADSVFADGASELFSSRRPYGASTRHRPSPGYGWERGAFVVVARSWPLGHDEGLGMSCPGLIPARCDECRWRAS